MRSRKEEHQGFAQWPPGDSGKSWCPSCLRGVVLWKYGQPFLGYYGISRIGIRIGEYVSDTDVIPCKLVRGGCENAYKWVLPLCFRSTSKGTPTTDHIVHSFPSCTLGIVLNVLMDIPVSNTVLLTIPMLATVR